MSVLAENVSRVVLGFSLAAPLLLAFAVRHENIPPATQTNYVPA